MRSAWIARQFAAVLAAVVLAPFGALAQPWPARPIRVVVPYAPGGVADTGARLLIERIGASLGVSLVVENRAGGGGHPGTDFVSKAQPDGYTLLVTTNGTISFAPVTNRNLPYDPTRDLAPVLMLGSYPLVLVVHAKLAVTNVTELIEHARKAPGKLNYSSPGVGSGTHFAAELFNTMAGVTVTHVPYKGAAPALQDVIAGNIEITFDGNAKPHVDAGRVRALAVTDLRRDPRFPTVPTLDEAGLKGYRIVGWLALFAPAGTPPDVVSRLNLAANAALSDERIKSRLTDLGLVPVGGAPERLTAQIVEEIDTFRRIAERSRLKFD